MPLVVRFLAHSVGVCVFIENACIILSSSSKIELTILCLLINIKPSNLDDTITQTNLAPKREMKKHF